MDLQKDLQKDYKVYFFSSLALPVNLFSQNAWYYGNSYSFAELGALNDSWIFLRWLKQIVMKRDIVW